MTKDEQLAELKRLHDRQAIMTSTYLVEKFKLDFPDWEKHASTVEHVEQLKALSF